MCSLMSQQDRPSWWQNSGREWKDTRPLGSELSHWHFYRILWAKANHKASQYWRGGGRGNQTPLIRGIVKTHWKGRAIGRGEELRPIMYAHNPKRKSKSNVRKKLKYSKAMFNEVSSPFLSYCVMTCDLKTHTTRFIQQRKKGLYPHFIPVIYEFHLSHSFT